MGMLWSYALAGSVRVSLFRLLSCRFIFDSVIDRDVSACDPCAYDQPREILASRAGEGLRTIRGGRRAEPDRVKQLGTVPRSSGLLPLLSHNLNPSVK